MDDRMHEFNVDPIPPMVEKDAGTGIFALVKCAVVEDLRDQVRNAQYEIARRTNGPVPEDYEDDGTMIEPVEWIRRMWEDDRARAAFILERVEAAMTMEQMDEALYLLPVKVEIDVWF